MALKKILLILLLLLATIPLAAKHSRCLNCPRDSHGRIKRSHAVREQFQKQFPCPSTEKSAGRCPGYVADHIYPLVCGGKDVIENMQWQTIREAREKDKIEVDCNESKEKKK